MRINKYILRSILIISVVATAVSSCRKDEGPDYDYFVSNELLFSYTEANINNLMDLAVMSYPEIAEIKPYVTDRCQCVQDGLYDNNRQMRRLKPQDWFVFPEHRELSGSELSERYQYKT